MPKISSSVLTRFSTELFLATNVSEHESRLVAESLVHSNLLGHDSHGVVQIPAYIERIRDGTVRPGTDLQILSESSSTMVADAVQGFGQVQMIAMIQRLVPKARNQGVACGTLKNCGHVGRLGEWVERTAQEGLAGFIATNDNGVLKCVAPPGGTAPTLSTNPLAIGVPTGDGVLVVDVSTSVVALGKVKLAFISGEQCPTGWLLDSKGHPTTDPAVRFTEPRGTIQPLGGDDYGYKGFGLGLLLDMLVGGLTGGSCPPAPDGTPGTNNVLFVIWDPENFSGQPHFLAETDKLIDFVRNTPRKEGVEAIRLPGDRGKTTFDQRTAEGIPLNEEIWKSLVSSADSLGVKCP